MSQFQKFRQSGSSANDPKFRFEIRPATLADARFLRPLLDQLGYALDETEIRDRIARLIESEGHCLVQAVDGEGGSLALLHVYGRPALEKPPEAVVQALVVQEEARGLGIGQAMMAYAEAWAAAQGYRHVSLSSRISRDRAHAFYRGLGYEQYRTSHQFRKTLT